LRRRTSRTTSDGSGSSCHRRRMFLGESAVVSVGRKKWRDSHPPYHPHTCTHTSIACTPTPTPIPPHTLTHDLVVSVPHRPRPTATLVPLCCCARVACVVRVCAPPTSRVHYNVSFVSPTPCWEPAFPANFIPRPPLAHAHILLPGTAIFADVQWHRLAHTGCRSESTSLPG
jgi:hypothetical protein